MVNAKQLRILFTVVLGKRVCVDVAFSPAPIRQGYDVGSTYRAAGAHRLVSNGEKTRGSPNSMKFPVAKGIKSSLAAASRIAAKGDKAVFGDVSCFSSKENKATGVHVPALFENGISVSESATPPRTLVRKPA